MELKNKHCYFIGIGGVSMSALAQFALNLGAIISGSDINENIYTRALEKKGIQIFYSQCATNLKDNIDIIVYTSAISKDNEELLEAQKRNLTILNRAEFLNEIASQYKTVIAVAGSHGKTTTTAMLAKVLIDAGFNPTVHIGGDFAEIGGNVRFGDGNVFITEACEYEKSFLSLSPDYGIVTNIDYDHVDTYKSPEEYKKSFEIFILKSRCCFVCEDKQLYDIYNKNAKCNNNNEKIMKKYIKNIKYCQNGCFVYDISIGDYVIKNIKLGVVGKFNVYNSALVVLVALKLGVPILQIKKSLLKFSGVERRFDKKQNYCGANVYADYAHHPTEITEMIKIGKMISRGKVVVIFQPHTYSRTQVFWNNFIESLKTADEIILYKIYSAREKEIKNINSKHLAEEIKKEHAKVVACDSFEDIKENLEVKKGDVVLILGAGDIVNFAKYLQNKNV